jgi:hypothetical protein
MTPEQEREVVLGLINHNRKTKLKMEETWYIKNEVMNQIYWRWESDKQIWEQDIGKKRYFNLEDVDVYFEDDITPLINCFGAGKKLVQVVKNPYLEKDYPYVVRNGYAILLKNIDIDEY